VSTLTTPSPVEPDPAASTQGAPSESAERPESPDSGGTLTVAVCIIAAVVTAAFLKWAAPVAIPVVSGVALAYCVKPVVRWMSRHDIAPAVAALISLSVVTALIGALGWLVWARALDLADRIPQAIPLIQERWISERGKERSAIDKVVAATDAVSAAVEATTAAPASSSGVPPTPAARAAKAAPPPPSKARPPPQQKADGTPKALPGWLIGGSLTLIGAAGGLASALLLAFFLLASGDHFRRVTVSVFGGAMSARRFTLSVLDDIDRSVQQCVGAILLSNLILGVATFLSLWMLGVDDALVWGVLATLLHLVPYIGTLLTAVGVFAATLVQAGSVMDAVTAAGVSALVAFSVGMVLQTWLMGRQARINSAAIFISVLLFGWLWGAMGALLGTPILMAFKAVAERIPRLWVVGAYLRA